MTRTPPRRQKVVSASELAEMGFCEVKIQLKQRLGDRNTAESAALRAEGRDRHAEFHRLTTQQHNTPSRDQGASSTRDRRCFIATVVYGVDDPRTDQLRQFRDLSLLPTRAGRVLVEVYYWVSPSIADLISKHHWMQQIVRLMLDSTRRRIASYPLAKESHHEPIDQQDASLPP